MRHLRIAVFFFLLAASINFGTHSSGPTEFLMVGSLGEVSDRSLAAKGVTLQQRGELCAYLVQDKAEATRACARALCTLKKQQAVIQNNLANAHTTLTVDGTPYRRQVVVVGADGQVEGIAEDDSDFNWAYEPSHPDACREGPHAGYVAKPNVNVESEKVRLAEVVQEEGRLRAFAAWLNPDLYVPEHICPAPPSDSDSGIDRDRLNEQVKAIGSPIEASFDPLVSSGLQDIEPRLQLRGLGLDDATSRIKPLAQSNGVSCGQTSVAVILNSLSDGYLTDGDIDRKWGFCLLDALKAESRPLGYTWYDAGEISPETRPAVEKSLSGHLPVLLALNGPEFSADGRGNIVVLSHCDGETVTYADPASGTFRTTTWQALFEAPSHPDGNFIFLARQGFPEFPPTGGNVSTEL